EQHEHQEEETVVDSSQDTHADQETVLPEEHEPEAGEHESEEGQHEHVRETGEGSHVHNSATAEAAQWVGVGTLVATASLFGINARTRYKAKGYRFVVMALAVGAGIIHLLLVPDHLSDVNVEHARFFVALGVAQISFGILFMPRPTKRFAIIGIVGNMGSIILYWITRIADLPEPFGAPEGLDAVGIITKIVEMSLVTLLIYLAVHYRKVRFLEASRA
ncbi:MAG: hypothetical protein ACRD38_02155, partial [Nitrososphaerales archaeon]